MSSGGNPQGGSRFYFGFGTQVLHHHAQQDNCREPQQQGDMLHHHPQNHHYPVPPSALHNLSALHVTTSHAAESSAGSDGGCSSGGGGGGCGQAATIKRSREMMEAETIHALKQGDITRSDLDPEEDAGDASRTPSCWRQRVCDYQHALVQPKTAPPPPPHHDEAFYGDSLFPSGHNSVGCCKEPKEAPSFRLGGSGGSSEAEVKPMAFSDASTTANDNNILVVRPHLQNLSFSMFEAPTAASLSSLSAPPPSPAGQELGLGRRGEKLHGSTSCITPLAEGGGEPEDGGGDDYYWQRYSSRGVEVSQRTHSASFDDYCGDGDLDGQRGRTGGDDDDDGDGVSSCIAFAGDSSAEEDMVLPHHQGYQRCFNRQGMAKCLPHRPLTGKKRDRHTAENNEEFPPPEVTSANAHTTMHHDGQSHTPTAGCAGFVLQDRDEATGPAVKVGFNKFLRQLDPFRDTVFRSSDQPPEQRQQQFHSLFPGAGGVVVGRHYGVRVPMIPPAQEESGGVNTHGTKRSIEDEEVKEADAPPSPWTPTPSVTTKKTITTLLRPTADQDTLLEIMLVIAQSGRRVPLGKFSRLDSLASLRERVEDKTGVPHTQQRLTVCGRELPNETTSNPDTGSPTSGAPPPSQRRRLEVEGLSHHFSSGCWGHHQGFTSSFEKKLRHPPHMAGLGFLNNMEDRHGLHGVYDDVEEPAQQVIDRDMCGGGAQFRIGADGQVFTNSTNNSLQSGGGSQLSPTLEECLDRNMRNRSSTEPLVDSSPTPNNTSGWASGSVYGTPPTLRGCSIWPTAGGSSSSSSSSVPPPRSMYTVLLFTPNARLL